MRSSSLVRVVAVLVAVTVMLTAEAQVPPCVMPLIPCTPYINATRRPPNTCCDPIKDAVANELECLCNLYKNSSYLDELVNITQTLNIPRLCGITTDTSVCYRAPPPATLQRPVFRPEGSVDKIASTGIIGLLLISACIMLF